MSLSAIAWDIDGTLVDSEPLHHVALLAASRRWDVDLSELDPETFRGVHMHDVWTALAPRFPAALTRERWMGAIDEHYGAEAAGLKPLLGVLDAIRSFAGAGLVQVCVSNSNRRIVDANLAALGIADLIAFSISFDDVTRGKPDPEPYRLACQRLALAPSQVLAVEDSQTGLRSARAAGLQTAAFVPDIADPLTVDFSFSRYDELVGWVTGGGRAAQRHADG